MEPPDGILCIDWTVVVVAILALGLVEILVWLLEIDVIKEVDVLTEFDAVVVAVIAVLVLVVMAVWLLEIDVIKEVGVLFGLDVVEA
jgi:hypothetical protein